jgi:kinesin family protein 3/17
LHPPLRARRQPEDERSASSRADEHQFAYDRVFDEQSSQAEVFEQTCQPVVHSVLEGYNGTVLAYGQTGTGKTFTMEGDVEGEMRGIIPRSAAEIFDYIQMDTGEYESQYLVRCSFCQIYNERISDLLSPERTDLRIRESGDGGTYIERLSEVVVKSPGDVYKLIIDGRAARNTNSTKMNATSSRSHAVFTVVVEHSQQDEHFPEKTDVTVGKLRLVDLAGSERYDVTTGEAKHQKETKEINKSLSAFGKVVLALTTRGNQHVPYRDSKLTRILQDSLGGNSKTTMIGTIGPMSSAYLEAVTTLKFTTRAKSVKNVAEVNKDNSESAMLTAMQAEIKRLHAQLAARQ